MRRIIRPFVILFSSLILTVSCLSDDSASYIYYSDTAITSFSLGTLNRTMWTKSSTGADSSYVEEIDGSDYHFYIDQAGRRIYNPDSLPVGTDAAHVICNIGSKNGGTVVIAYKDTEGADSLAYYSSSDSIDFSEPLDFRVYANDGMNFRTYKISVNVHKEDPDSFTWQRMDGMASRTFRQFDAMKATTLGRRLIVMGRDGSATRVMISNGGAWTEGASLADGEAWANAVVKGDSLFTISGGQIMRTADGNTWDACGQAGDLPVRLMAAGSVKLYGIDAQGRVVSSAHGGYGWTADEITGDASMLPATGAGYGYAALKTDDTAERIIMVGNRDLSAHAEDSVAMVWSKIEEYSNAARQHSWIQCEGDAKYRLPSLTNLSVTAYGDVMLAIGGKGAGASTAEAFSKVYVSLDNGLTWAVDGSYYLPEDFTNGVSDVFAMTADDDNFIWIICGGTGDVWRGRLNRLGWPEEQTSFTE